VDQADHTIPSGTISADEAIIRSQLDPCLIRQTRSNLPMQHPHFAFA
jgi:hypothetical protein